ncbi:NADH-quinone oxidoreductase subunit NuoE family protein [Desulfovibrio psychrotolerans]|uniref:NADH dehydrogenase n=1 Tax=Desulfovibrio psychrotolerans TaxID=415242 RepID=A0A7J0BQV4_9BACT|nr:NAD(P)H-dependent oxidoreductase subunit E [Desulfovibrio psychrotolerans]GFM36096.1 hypothetical protein DSM19430T_07800 [Desulfovibrio psychrotolerans]
MSRSDSSGPKKSGSKKFEPRTFDTDTSGRDLPRPDASGPNLLGPDTTGTAISDAGPLCPDASGADIFPAGNSPHATGGAHAGCRGDSCCCGEEAGSSRHAVTPEQWAAVDAVIARHRHVPGSLITVLREAQEVVGYFPTPLLDRIAEGMNIPGSDVFGVVSFYSLFSLEPRGRHSIKACTGTACYVKGIREVISRIAGEYGIREGQTTQDGRFDLEGVRCLGACGLAPVMVVGGDTHGAVSADTVLELLKKYA